MLWAKEECASGRRLPGCWLQISRCSCSYHSYNHPIGFAGKDRDAYTSIMPNRSRKKQPARDFNQLARAIVDQATGEPSAPPAKKPVKKKNPAAVALGRWVA